MQHDQAHAFPDALLNALDDGVLDLAVRGMAPPDEHVGLGQAFLGQAVLGILQDDGPGLDVLVLVEGRRDGAMHAERIEAGDDLAGLLMNVFAPYQCANVGCKNVGVFFRDDLCGC